MRFVETKTPDQQSCLMLHRTRHLFIRQQTAVTSVPILPSSDRRAGGRNGVEELLGVVADASDKRLAEIARACLAALGAQLRMLKAQILEFDRMINARHRSNETSKRLDEIPGVGPALATAPTRSPLRRLICGMTASLLLFPRVFDSSVFILRFRIAYLSRSRSSPALVAFRVAGLFAALSRAK